MTTINIKQLGQSDWQDYKAIRLQALRDNGDVFLPDNDETTLSDQDWRDDLTDESCAIFGLYDGKKIVGLTAVFTWKGDASGKTAILAMDFVDFSYRGQGLSRLFYQARIDWAKKQNRFDVIRVSHREGNEASRRANQAAGFVLIGQGATTWPDGQKDNEFIYELRL